MDVETMRRVLINIGQDNPGLVLDLMENAPQREGHLPPPPADSPGKGSKLDKEDLVDRLSEHGKEEMAAFKLLGKRGSRTKLNAIIGKLSVN